MFNKTIKNIMSNYIPHETFICDDRDPSWINKDIKQLNLGKNHAYKSYFGNDRSLKLFNQLWFLQAKLNPLIEESKNRYYTPLSYRLVDPITSQKSYWSILKTFRIIQKFLAFRYYYIRTNLLLNSKKKPTFWII